MAKRSVTKTGTQRFCLFCLAPLYGTQRKKYCSATCRALHWRKRKETKDAISTANHLRTNQRTGGSIMHDMKELFILALDEVHVPDDAFFAYIDAHRQELTQLRDTLTLVLQSFEPGEITE